MTQQLSTTDHNRDMAGLTYVYPVLSRRAGGVSIGVNVNTNNACNWRCVYCQVPDLRVGVAPDIDFSLLAKELREFLQKVLQGDFYDQYQVTPAMRMIKDIAISGNGEPTTSKAFAELIRVIGTIAQEAGILPESKLILITNGSLIHQAHVQQGLQQLQALGGEVWFKFDSATAEGRQKMNHSGQSLSQALNNLQLSAALCHTKIQTCLLDYAGEGWPMEEQQAYLAALQQVSDLPGLREVMLYSLARPSHQPEANQISALSVERMQAFATEIRQLGFEVSVY